MAGKPLSLSSQYLEVAHIKQADSLCPEEELGAEIEIHNREFF